VVVTMKSGRPASDSPPGSTSKALALLRVLAERGEPVQLAELVRACGMSKPTGHRVLAQLRELAWVRTHEGGRYSLGPQAHAFAAMTSSGTSTEETLALLRDTVGHTVHVGVLSGGAVVYTHKLDGHDPFVMKSRVGGTMPLHCTGIGKALLAHLPDDEVRAVLAAGLPRRTPATFTDARALRAELQAIRERGYSVDDEENEPNIRCVATIVPETGGQPLTAVSISTVTFLTDREQLLEYVPALQETARRLAAARPPG
jgi:IclR family transcriptional regulator, acetate operon repressor